MARAGLGWSAHDLADAAGVGYATVARFESGGVVNSDSLDKIAQAFAAAGVSFSSGKGRIGATVPE